MEADAHFKLNDANVVQEVFEGEVLAINLDTGTYYSMPGLSAQVWKSVIAGVPSRTICLALSQLYPQEPVSTVVAEFVGKLKEHHLVVASDSAASNDSLSFTPLEDQPLSLTFDVYTDMQDLLLLDPIHDVEEGGWPLAKEKRDEPPK